jgi:hypothetical protein
MSTWPPPESEPGFARIEDLDPEPATGRRTGPRREQIIGIGLLVVLAVLAAVQWRDSQARLAHYQAGSRAAAAQDWDIARREFTGAGSYNDAAARAADTVALRDERDRTYQVLSEAARADDWPIALAASRRLRNIATHYRDVPELTRQAEQAVYAATLSGTIALRARATPPGLYAYGAGGWHYLQESDARSRVRAACPNGAALFDIPAGNGTAERRLVVAPLDGGPVRYRVGLDLGRSNAYLCTESGVWASLYYVNSGFPGLLSGLSLPHPSILAYQPFGGQLLVPSTPFGAGGLGVNIAPDGRHILTADLTGYDFVTAQTRLYLIDPRTRDLRLLDTRPGWLERDEVSPDGRYVLFIVDRPMSDMAHFVNIFLLDMDGKPTQTLAVTHEELNNDPTPTGGVRATGAFFIPNGPRAGQILLTWRDAGGHRVQLLDPANITRPLAGWIVPDPAAELRFFSTNAPDGGLLAGWQEPDGRGATIGYLDGHNTLQLLDLPDNPGALLWRGAVRGDRLIYTTQQTDLVARATSYVVHSVPLPLPAPRRTTPPVILQRATVPEGQEPPAAWALGDALFAYLTPAGELRAQTYTSSVDILLESGVTALYPTVAGNTP